MSDSLKRGVAVVRMNGDRSLPHVVPVPEGDRPPSLRLSPLGLSDWLVRTLVGQHLMAEVRELNAATDAALKHRAAALARQQALTGRNDP